MFGGINGVAMNVLELARRILIASVNRETTGKYCTHLFLRRLFVFVFSGWGGVFRDWIFERTWIIVRREERICWKLVGDKILILEEDFDRILITQILF